MIKVNLSISKRDHEICSGCYCYMLSNKTTSPLNGICHGNPFILVHSQIIKCPCNKCLIKTMCKTICIKYEKYKALERGTITMEIYETDE